MVGKMKEKTIKIIITAMGIIVIIFSILVVLICIAVLCFRGYFKLPFDKTMMEKCLNEDYETLMIVVDYLENSEHNYFHIELRENGLHNHYSIEDEIIIEAITELKKRGYESITKYDQIIKVQKWSNWEKSRGAAYSLYGTIPEALSIEFLIKSEPLEKDKWYYYELDYYEWEKRIKAIS